MIYVVVLSSLSEAVIQMCRKKTKTKTFYIIAYSCMEFRVPTKRNHIKEAPHSATLSVPISVTTVYVMNIETR